GAHARGRRSARRQAPWARGRGRTRNAAWAGETTSRAPPPRRLGRADPPTWPRSAAPEPRDSRGQDTLPPYTCFFPGESAEGGPMALFNHAAKELTAKIVYYGPGLCGKTSNLKSLHQRLGHGTGKLLSLSTAQDRTIFFDLLPVELANIKGYKVRFQVCTVPGQVFYNETRKIVLRGVDGLVFVVDSQWSMLSHNLESFQNLKENLHGEKISLETLPVVIQYNKRDLPSALSVEALQDALGFHSYPFVEAVASEGSGVIETFKLASKLTFVDLLRRLQRGSDGAFPGLSDDLSGPIRAATEVLDEAPPQDVPEPTSLASAVLLA